MSGPPFRPLVVVAVVTAGVLVTSRASHAGAVRSFGDHGPDPGSAEHAAACRTHPQVNAGCSSLVK